MLKTSVFLDEEWEGGKVGHRQRSANGEQTCFSEKCAFSDSRISLRAGGNARGHLQRETGEGRCGVDYHFAI